MLSNGSKIIEELNRQRFHDLMPVVIFMSLLTIAGVIGNAIVIFIYTTRFPKTSSSYFILCLAVLDLLTCMIGIPFDIVDLSYWFDFPSTAICKILRFVSYFTVLASAITLIVIAFDRYYKVCRPLKRFSPKFTKILIGVAVGIGLGFTWPALAIFGDNDSSIEYMNYNISTVKCSVTDNINPLYPVIYYAILALIFITCTVFLIVLYTALLNTLRKQNKRLSKKQKTPYTRKTTTPSPETGVSTDIQATKETKKNKCRAVKSNDSHKPIVTGGRKNLNTERTTAIFLAISCVYVLSYLPCLILVIARTMIPDIEDFPSVAADVTYQIFMRSYFINNAVNPIIYGLLNPRFRKECVDAARLLAKKCPCSCDCKIGRYSIHNKGKITDTSDDSMGSLRCSSGKTNNTEVSDASLGSQKPQDEHQSMEIHEIATTSLNAPP